MQNCGNAKTVAMQEAVQYSQLFLSSTSPDSYDGFQDS